MLFADAIEEFKQLHPEYATPEGAKNRCADATVEFLDLLVARGFLDRYNHGNVYEYAEAAVVDHTVHRAARIGFVMIDWTARQFDPTADWPKITVDPRYWLSPTLGKGPCTPPRRT